MKKLIVYLLGLAVICSLCACGSIAQHGNGTEGTTQVAVINSSSEEIYGIEYAYYVNGDLYSSGGGCYADNSAIKIGDEFALENQSYLEDAENVEVEISVVSKSGKEYPCSSRIGVDIEKGITCEIKITGDYEEGFHITQISNLNNVKIRENTYEIGITLPPDAIEMGVNEQIDYSDVEILPTKSKIIIYATQSLGDAGVVLIPIDAMEENEYQPTYITPGMPIEMDVEKGTWYKIGVAKYNDSDADKTVYVRVEGVETRVD
ncbi:MAG: hypothetical protein J6I97_03285 [Agathobacter sp.]|nr:hypothetical protein [Agathobacter sp.]